MEAARHEADRDSHAIPVSNRHHEERTHDHSRTLPLAGRVHLVKLVRPVITLAKLLSLES